MGSGAWAEAARSGPAHDVVVVVASCPGDAAGVAADLARRPTRTGGTPLVVEVVEPPDQRLGNLGGTLRAWEAVRDRADVAGRRAAGGAVLMLHDAGAASRSAGWAEALGGRRGRLPLPGRDVAGQGMTLMTAVARLSAPLCRSNPGGVVDVVWTSQLVLPDLDPADVAAPSADLTKLGMGWSGPVSDVAARELGWFGLGEGGVEAFAPGGTFADAAAWARWTAGRRAADVGSFRVSARWLDLLASAGLGRIDLDPGLTGPVVARREAGPLAALVSRVGRPTVGLLTLPAGSCWRRVRRGDEVAAAMRALWADEALRRALGVDRPLDGVRLGGVDASALGWAEVEAGVEVGGVRVRRSILRDVDVAAGAVDGVVAVEAWAGERVRLGGVNVS